MSTVLLVSPTPLSGKTTIAAGLAERAKALGTTDITFTEAPAGPPAATHSQDASIRTIVVATGTTPAAEIAAYCEPIGDSLAGVIVNRVPQRRLDSTRAEYQSASVNVIAMLLEDRLLAAPTLGEVAAALGADASILDGNQSHPVEHPLISSISADPGQGYFTRHGATTVIIRSDKPDLQLAALNAGVRCLIVTGGMPILSYVLERAEADEVPLLRTALDTVAAVGRIEDLYGTTPFAGGEAKLARIQELLADVDIPGVTS